MSKKRKTIYIMLPVIIVVWGYVLFQFFSFFSSSPNYAEEKPDSPINIDKVEIDTFSIIANYRDPFLDKRYSTPIKTQRKEKKRTTK